ncbi:hypothetical protein, partial [Arthrobacter sp. AQ5-05]|uniref:hypothetical protein n=1 Tax=Arthrobacter sp. AQ5-05 TaxID=2184581 RepID=UPI001C658157
RHSSSLNSWLNLRRVGDISVIPHSGEPHHFMGHHCPKYPEQPTPCPTTVTDVVRHQPSPKS